MCAFASPLENSTEQTDHIYRFPGRSLGGDKRTESCDRNRHGREFYSLRLYQRGLCTTKFDHLSKHQETQNKVEKNENDISLFYLTNTQSTSIYLIEFGTAVIVKRQVARKQVSILIYIVCDSSRGKGCHANSGTSSADQQKNNCRCKHYVIRDSDSREKILWFKGAHTGAYRHSINLCIARFMNRKSS